MPVSSSTEHWIKPDALTINLNHFGDPDYLQVSVLAGAVIMVFKQDVIGYNAAHNYRTWPLEAANTYLETTSAYNVYARLTRSEVNARALVVYDTVLRDIEGREITYAEDGSEVLGEANPDYFFVFLGQISASVNSNGEHVSRIWKTDYIAGTLDTTEQKNYSGLIFEKMFRPHFEDKNDPERLTSIEALSGLWTESFLSARGKNTSGSGGGGGLVQSVYGYGSFGGTFNDSNLNDTFNAYAINRLYLRIKALEESGLDESELAAYLTANNYAKKTDIPAIPTNVSAFNNDAGYVSEDDVSALITNNFVSLWATEMGKWFAVDEETGAIYPVGGRGFFSESFISARGANSSGSGSGGGLVQTVYGYNDLSKTFSDATLTDTFNAYTISRLASRIATLENKTITEVSWGIVTGKPSWLTDSVPNVSTFTNDAGYATVSDVDSRIDALVSGAPAAFDTLKEIADVLQSNVNSIGDIITALGGKADKATTLSGYGITDAYTITQVNDLLSGKVDKTDYASLWLSEMSKWFAIDEATGGIYPVGDRGFFSNSFISARGVNDSSSSGGSTTLAGLLDVTLSSPSVGESLVYDGDKWVNRLVEGGIGELTSSMVVSALGYTPVAPTDLSGYATVSALSNKVDFIGQVNNPNNHINSSLGYSGAVNTPNGDSIALFTSTVVGAYGGQLAVAVTGGTLYSRGFVAGSWGSWRTHLDSSNYSSYALPLTGGTVKGDLNINSQTDTTKRYLRMWYYASNRQNRGMLSVGADSVELDYYSPTDGIDHYITVGRNGFKYNSYNVLHSSNYSSYALPLSGGRMNGTIILPNNTYIDSQDGSTMLGIYANSGCLVGVSEHPLLLRSNGTSTINGNTILHSGNYNSYALPLSGGTLTGKEAILTLNSTTANSWIYLASNNVMKVSIAYYNNFAAISNENTLARIGINDSGVAQYWNNASGTVKYNLLHAGNYTSYTLPLTGGELASTTTDTPLYLRSNDNSSSWIGFRTNSGTNLGWLGILASDGQPYFFGSAGVNFKIWHSGNDGSGSGLDADTLDGYQPSSLNVASATKLQTARTIWGQSFDGTGNIVGGIFLNRYNLSGNSSGADIVINKGGDYFGLGASTASVSSFSLGTTSNTTGTWKSEYLTFNNIGYVGIGTTSPISKLSVVSDSTTNGDVIRIDSKAGWCGIVYQVASSYTWSVNAGTDGMFNFWNSYFQDEAATLSHTGVFHTLGGITSAGYITARSSSSDIRLKKDLTDYNAMGLIRSKRSVMYHWNDVAKANSEIFNTDAWQFGLIAQEVEDTHPQLVSNVFGDYLTINYERLIPILWRGVQELDIHLSEHDREIMLLKEENKMLRDRINELERRVA